MAGVLTHAKENRSPSAYPPPIYPPNTALTRNPKWVLKSSQIYIIKKKKKKKRFDILNETDIELRPCWGPRWSGCKRGGRARQGHWNLWRRPLCSWRSFHGRTWRSKALCPLATASLASIPHHRLSALSPFPLLFERWKSINKNNGLWVLGYLLALQSRMDSSSGLNIRPNVRWKLDYTNYGLCVCIQPAYLTNPI